MRPFRYLAVLALLAAPAQGQVLGHVSAGYGAQSSYGHPSFVAAELALAPAPAWLLVGTARRSAWQGMDGWRAQLSLQRRLGSGFVRPYVGAGLSWTNEASEMAWDGSELGAMALVGLEVPVARPGASALLLFGEADMYSHRYATGQVLFGARWQFGR